jgi:hypothetical protein
LKGASIGETFRFFPLHDSDGIAAIREDERRRATNAAVTDYTDVSHARAFRSSRSTSEQTTARA